MGSTPTVPLNDKSRKVITQRDYAREMEHFIDIYSVSVERIFAFSRANTEKECVEYYKLRLPKHRILNAVFQDKEFEMPSRKLHFLLFYFTLYKKENQFKDRLKGIGHMEGMLKFIYPGESQQRHKILLAEFEILDRNNQREFERAKVTLEWYNKKQYPYILFNEVIHNLRVFNQLYLIRIPYRDLFHTIRNQYKEIKQEWEINSDLRELIAFKPCFITEEEYRNLKNNQGKTFQLYEFLVARVTRDQEEGIRLIKYEKPKYEKGNVIPALLRILLPDEERAEDNDYGYCYVDKTTRKEIIINCLNSLKIRRVRKVVSDGKEVIRIDLQYGTISNLLYRFRQNRRITKNQKSPNKSGSKNESLIIFEVQDQKDEEEDMKIQRQAVNSVVVEYVKQKTSKLEKKNSVRDDLENKKYGQTEEDETLLNYYFMQVQEFKKVEDDGTLLAFLDENQSSISFYDRKLKKIHSEIDRAKTLNKYGIIHLRSHKYREAMLLFDQAMKTFMKEKQNNLIEIIAVKFNKSICLQEMGKLDDALNYHIKTIDEIQKPFFKKIYGTQYKLHVIYKCGLANCYRKMGKVSTAKKVLEKLAPIVQKNDEDPESMSEFLESFGLLYLEASGDIISNAQISINCFRKALYIHKNSENYMKIGICLGLLADAERRLQDFDEAHKLCQTAIEYLNRVVKSQIHLCKIARIQGDICKNVMEFREAIKFYARAIKLKQEVFDPDSPFLAQLYADVGLACRMGKYYQDARKNYKIAMSLLPRGDPMYKVYQRELQQKCMPAFG